MDLKLVREVNFITWPFEWKLAGFGDLNSIYQEFAVDRYGLSR